MRKNMNNKHLLEIALNKPFIYINAVSTSSYFDLNIKER